jgi:hypothetical protein
LVLELEVPVNASVQSVVGYFEQLVELEQMVAFVMVELELEALLAALYDAVMLEYLLVVKPLFVVAVQMLVRQSALELVAEELKLVFELQLELIELLVPLEH